MPFRSARAAVLGAALLAGLLAVVLPAARATTTYPIATVTSRSAGSNGSTLLHFAVHVGPQRATTCDIVAELFLPKDQRNPVPAILTTNGFGGSYQDQESLAKFFAPRGYAVLTYSGLGFGGSGCLIELDDPDWDGAAASQLISWLGAQPEILKDGPGDPRVGMVGGSYGGDIQFSTAAVDPRLDAIVPIITWNDLAYSLGPNNTAADFVHTDAEAGVEKLGWSTLFTVVGLTEPLMHAGTVTRCPGFDARVCDGYVASAALGYLTRGTIDLLRHTSMVSFGPHVRIPTMLMQGEGDTLFTINEAVANYRLLKAQGTPVKLVIQSWGHSQGTPAPGEVSYKSVDKGYETLLIADWFAKYLQHSPVSTGPPVEYFRDWVSYDHKGSAAPAYGTAPTWPVGSSRRWQWSQIQTFVNPAGGVPASYSETSALQGSPPFSNINPTDVPGTFTAYQTAPLTTSMDSVGVPVATVSLSALVPPGVDPATDPVVFAKIYDVAPDGTVTLVQRQVAPLRIDDVSHPVTMTLPGVVHRYAAGHRLRLVLAATDAAYAGSRIPNVLTVHGATLDVPVVSAVDETTGGVRASGA